MATTPLTPIVPAVTAPKPFDPNMFAGHREKDQNLYLQWKETGSKRDLGNLLDQLSPIIYKEVHRASGSLPTSALAAEAKNWTIKAIKTYDPSKGTLLSTHVSNYLPKIRRMNYKYQNAVRLPENMQLQYHDFNKTVTDLTDTLSREPTDDEIAKQLGWSTKNTTKFKNSLYADLVESASDRPTEYAQFNDNAILMEYLVSQLSPDERYIMENAKSKSASDIAKKLGVNINRYNYLKSKLIEKIKKIQRSNGMM